MSRKYVSWICVVALLAVWVGQAMAAGPMPLVYYPFNELEGTVPDASGNGLDGAPNGGLELVAGGYDGRCYSFNGSNSYVELNRPVQDSFTLAAWIKTETTGLAGTQAYQGSGLFWSDVAGTANDFVVAVLGTKLSFFTGNPDASVNSNGDIVTSDWVHIAAVRDTAAGAISVYINGALDNSVAHANTGPLDAQPLLAIGANTLDSRYYTGLMDDVKIYDVALAEAEVRQAMKAGLRVEFASDPVPADGQGDVPRDVVLQWKAGEFAAAHDVYFGTSFDDVNTAGQANPLGALVSQGQSGTSYDPAGMLDFGQTYYWRIDEVNAAPDNTIFKGDVWSFTAEPLAYPIANVVATSNAVSEPGAGPENAVNGSGLSTAGQHSTDSGDMWVGGTGGAEPVWIQFEFDKVYLLHELQVWNYNVIFELMLGFGFKDVTIEHSEDGESWTTFGDVQFAQATAKTSYTANTTVDLSGVAARFVRLTANSAWGATGQFGLSEVQFLFVPVQAREPQPEAGAVDVSVGAILDWRSGRQAASHEVYLGTEEVAVIDGTALAGTVGQSQYDPATLDLDATYYWRIDEVNEAEAIASWAGEIWSFSTQPFIVIDNFESYTDDIDAGEAIFDTWLDGWVNGTGSTVGYLSTPFAERTTVHGGHQSMPLFYEGNSRTDLTMDTQDWTAGGATTLVVYFRGGIDNGAGQFYATVNGTKVTYPGVLTSPVWKQWNIDLASLGTNLTSVTSFSLGVDGSGSGLLFVDDIRLHRVAPEPVVPADPGTTGLLASYAFENNVQDGSGNGYHGTAFNDPAYLASRPGQGQAINFDGFADYVELPIGPAMGTLSSATVAMWVDFSAASGSWVRIFDFGNSSTTGYMFLCPRGSTSGPMRFAITPAGGTSESIIETSRQLPTDDWHHVAVVIDSATMTVDIYVDGEVAGSGATETLPADLGATTQNWLARSQYTADAYFAGSLDDLMIYSRTLSPGEIRYLAGDR